MANEKEEQEELNQIWSLFKDTDISEDVRNKRQQVTKNLNDNDLSSFPSTLHVSTAFDELFQCFSIGGQVKNLYRYGQLSYCERQREKLWFALWYGKFFDMSKQQEDNSTNGKKIQQFYKSRLLQDQAKGSSEDIWEARKKPLINPFKEEEE